MNIASCVICSELFNDLNSISAAPCGHVYHTDCLKSWVATSKTCPECRSKTYLKTIKKLYFNYMSKSDLSSLDLEGKITFVSTQLSAKNEELEAFEKERDEIFAFMRGAKEKVCNVKDSVFKLAKEVKELRLKAEEVPKLEAKVLMLEKKNAILCNDSSIYKVCDCTTKRLQDGKDTLKDYGGYFETCLKQELPKAVKSRDKLQDLNYKLKHENCTYAVEKPRDNAMKLRNRVLKKSKSSPERFFPLDFDEKNPFASTDTKTKFSNKMDKMLRREKLYGDAMNLRKRVFIKSTSSLETLSPLVDFDEKNLFASTFTESKFSNEMDKMLKREKLYKDAMKFRNRLLTSGSVSSVETLSPLEDFDENVFVSTTTKSKFSEEMGKMLDRVKLYEEAMKFRNGLFTENASSIEVLSPLIDFDEKNVFASTSTRSNFSKEMKKMLERENYTHIAEKSRNDAMQKRKAKLPASNALGKKTNMRKKAPAPASSAALSSQNNLELTATVSSRKKKTARYPI